MGVNIPNLIFASMKSAIFLSFTSLLIVLSACHKCYECTVQTEDFGEVSKNVCGKDRTISGLINELETDTVGNGPWICEKI